MPLRITRIIAQSTSTIGHISGIVAGATKIPPHEWSMWGVSAVLNEEPLS